jgi:hypothetical protein
LTDIETRQAAIDAGRAFIARDLSLPQAEFWTALAKQAANGRLQ